MPQREQHLRDQQLSRLQGSTAETQPTEPGFMPARGAGVQQTHKQLAVSSAAASALPQWCSACAKDVGRGGGGSLLLLLLAQL